MAEWILPVNANSGTVVNPMVGAVGKWRTVQDCSSRIAHKNGIAADTAFQRRYGYMEVCKFCARVNVLEYS